jgi:hypothetical protein
MRSAAIEGTFTLPGHAQRHVQIVDPGSLRVQGQHEWLLGECRGKAVELDLPPVAPLPANGVGKHRHENRRRNQSRVRSAWRRSAPTRCSPLPPKLWASWKYSCLVYAAGARILSDRPAA